MDPKVLVTYASELGATEEIAAKIGETLRQAGLQADVVSVENVLDLAPYQAVVLGCAVYVGSWPKMAVAFLEAREKDLACRPFWLFSSGPTGEGEPAVLLNGWRMPAAMQPLVERIGPRDVAVFHGYINPAKLNFVQRWAIKNVVKKPFGDYRDWDAIERWARTVAASLKDQEPTVV